MKVTNPKVTKLEQQKGRRKSWSVFVDEEFVFALDEVDLLYYKLSEGNEISPQRLEYIRDQVVLSKANQKALDFLSYRPRTVKEVEKKLSAEYASDIIARVMDMLYEYKYVDDALYALEYAKERVNAGYGPFKIEWELKGRGVEQGLIDTAIESVRADFVKSAIAALRFKYREKPILDSVEKGRAYNFLMRRGFEMDTVDEALRSRG